jgi:hypothetical protein
MAKPPPSGPSSDIEGVHQSSQAHEPGRHPEHGTAEHKQDAEKDSKGRPIQTEQKPGGDQ